MADNRHAGEIVAERYQLVAPLGQGGFGSVWTATRLNDGRRVALKFLKPGLGRGALRRFAREAAVLSRIEHPNCVEFIDFDPNNKPPVLVNEVVEGQTLREWAKQPHEVDEIVEVAGQIATGLQASGDLTCRPRTSTV